MNSYTTRLGDMWDGIALRTLGSEEYMPDLLDANPAYNYVCIFDAGVVLVVPPLPAAPLPSSLPPWVTP